MSNVEPEAIRELAFALSLHADAAAPEENWLNAERELLVAHEYDTPDRDLEQAGVHIARLPLEAGVVWRLTLPKGEQVEVWTAGTEGLELPSEIAQLVGGVVADKQLVPAPPLSGDPGAKRLRASLLEQRASLLRHDPGVRLAEDPTNLRKHRVAARRARAFLRATRRYVDPEWRASLAEPLSRLGDVTGPARDLDVVLGHVRAELATLDPLDGSGGAALLDTLERAHRAAHRQLLDALTSDAYRTVVSRMRLPPRLASGVETIPLAAIARKEFDRLAKDVRRLGRHPDEGALHSLRIALKRARYAAELSRLPGKRGTRFLDDAKALQDLLGEHQDAVVAEQLLRSTTVVDPATAAAFVAGRLAERQRRRRTNVTERLPAAWSQLRRSGKRLK